MSDTIFFYTHNNIHEFALTGMMKRLFGLIGFLMIPILLMGCKKNGDNLDGLRVRDPFIYLDPITKAYYMPISVFPGVKMFKSADLISWEDLGTCFEPDSTFWGKKDDWAPDLYFYNNKYYIFVTYSNNLITRGTTILVADKIAGPYVPLINNPITPSYWMCLDASLYVDDANNPWIIYAHEWGEAIDGKVVAQRITKDFKNTVGEPHILFAASDGPWVGKVLVTDAPFIYKKANGQLALLWSSFSKNHKYAIGSATSTGGVLGPWVQSAKPLNDDDGGHAMIFKDKGTLRISYHCTNGDPHLKVSELLENANELQIVKK